MGWGGVGGWVVGWVGGWCGVGWWWGVGAENAREEKTDKPTEKRKPNKGKSNTWNAEEQ